VALTVEVGSIPLPDPRLVLSEGLLEDSADHLSRSAMSCPNSSCGGRVEFGGLLVDPLQMFYDQVSCTMRPMPSEAAKLGL
jgi:hypothetical protein